MVVVVVVVNQMVIIIIVIGTSDDGCATRWLLLLSQVHQMVDACGGRLVSIGQGLAVVRFNGGFEYAKWAKRRLDGEEIFGNRIFVKIPFLDANAHKGRCN